MFLPITQLPVAGREYYRKRVVDHTENLQLQNNLNSQNTTHPEDRTVKSIQTKLKNNNAMITTADKGNSIVILPIQQYETKI
jgi:hypothetical protein